MLYDDFGVCGAARMWWVFKCFGIQTHVLDGGMKAWKKEGLGVDSAKLSAEEIWRLGGWGYEKGKDGPGKTRVLFFFSHAHHFTADRRDEEDSDQQSRIRIRL